MRPAEHQIRCYACRRLLARATAPARAAIAVAARVELQGGRCKAPNILIGRSCSAPASLGHAGLRDAPPKRARRTSDPLLT